MGLPPISIIGLGRNDDSSEMRVPLPPAKITTFMATNIYNASMAESVATLINVKNGEFFFEVYF